MWNQQGRSFESIGLSVGATNLTGISLGNSAGHPAVMRASDVTVDGHRLVGFVERVGDPVPLVAPDGSTHRPEGLLADALDGVAHAVSDHAASADVAVAVPAHWRPFMVDAVRATLGAGVSVVSDAKAALTALAAGPGLPARGVVVLADFGGSGASITLANASANYELVGETVRHADFSGDAVDQALLRHVMSSLDTSQTDPLGTAMVGSLVSMRAECRRAKERLSAYTATPVTVELLGRRSEIRLTRAELEDVVKPLFASFLATLDDTLQRYGVPAGAVAAVATIGGCARSPAITQMLSAHLGAPVVTTPHPALTAAEGAAVIAQRSAVVEIATTVTPTPEEPSTALSALAWSDTVEEPLPSARVDHAEPEVRPEVVFRHDVQAEPEQAPRRIPLILFGLSAAAAAVTTAIFVAMQLTGGSTTPVEAAVTVAPPSAPAAPVPSPTPPAPQASPVSTVVVQPAQRSQAAPRKQAPVSHEPAPTTDAPPPPPPPPTTEAPPPTTTPWTPPPWMPPWPSPWTPPWTPPSTPPSAPPSTPPTTPPSTPPTTPPADSGGGSKAPSADPGPPPSDDGGKGRRQRAEGAETVS